MLAKANFHEYLEVVGQSIKFLSGDECYNNIQAAFEQVNGYSIFHQTTSL